MKNKYKELFSYMTQNHDVTLFQNEMQDLIDVVEKSRWIKIEDELPPLRTYVIGYVINLFGRGKNYVSEVYFSSDQEWLINIDDECIVTHWMPLPYPPKE